MPPALAFPSPAQSSAFGKVRDARICWLLSMHPVTAGMLVQIGWFRGRKKALKRLRRLVLRRRVLLVGTVCRKAGRPENVYCRYRPKVDSLLHEVELTELCLRLDAGRIVRGPGATDRQIRPDAEVWINGRHFSLELDRGTMGYAQLLRRFRAYESVPHLVLWICPTAERRDGLRARAERLRHNALFTTVAEVLAAPHGPVWLDYRGNRAALPRETSQSFVTGSRPLS